MRNGEYGRPPKRARLLNQAILENRPRTIERLKEELCRLLSAEKSDDFTKLNENAT